MAVVASGLARAWLRSSHKTGKLVLPDKPQSLFLGPLRAPTRASPLATIAVNHQSLPRIHALVFL